MKKLFIAIISLTLIAVCLSGCGNSAKSNVTLNITDENFLTLVTDIYKNSTDYTSKTIKIEGLYMADGHDGHSHYYVYRNAAVYDSGHGHNHVQRLGFEFTYSGNLPKDNDWVEVVGALRLHDSHGNKILRLDANSVTVLNKRGAETIGNMDEVHNDEEDNDEHHN